MAKTDILDYSTTPAENQDINNISTLGTAKPNVIDDIVRAQMSHIAKGLVTRRVAKDTAYTAVKADHNQMIDFTETATLTTSAAATLTDGWLCTIRASGGDVTVNPNGSETVNGEETAVIKEGGTAILRVFDGNFLLNYFVGGGANSDIIYDEAVFSISSSTPLEIPDIAPEFRRLEIEGEISSISSAVQASYLALSVGSGGTFWEIPDNALYCLTYWAAGGASGSRRFFASIDNLDDEALSITYKTIRNPAVPPEDGNYFVTPASFSARPVDAIRIRLSTTTTVKTASVAKLRVRGIRA